jgi:hypothetical protein
MRKRRLVVTSLDKPIETLAGKSDQKALATWAADCAERALPYFEENHPEDDRPRKAIESARAWVRTGVFKMADVRAASLAAHAAARDVADDDPARSAARAAGQAIAVAHVAAHSIAAARYAATAVRDATGSSEAVDEERKWQYEHLLELGERQQDSAG